MLSGQKTKRSSQGEVTQNPTILGLFRQDTTTPLFPWVISIVGPEEPLLDPTFMPLKNVCFLFPSHYPIPCRDSPAHRGAPPKCFNFKFGLDWVKGMGGQRSPNWHWWEVWQGGCFWKPAQRGTGAHLISCGLDWQALLRPLSAWALPQKGWVGNYSMLCLCCYYYISKPAPIFIWPSHDNVKNTLAWSPFKHFSFCVPSHTNKTCEKTTTE